MDEWKVVDYFVIAGLPSDYELLEDFSRDNSQLKAAHSKAPITDITVIFPSQEEKAPEGYTVIKRTPTGITADLNHGSIRSQEVFLCYRRGRDKPPLVDIGVMYEGKERILSDSEIVEFTPGGRPANVNNSTSKTFLTYRRAQPTIPCNALVVTDIAVIITSKGETVPHAFCMIKKNLNKGLVGSDVYICYKKSMNRANLINYKSSILLRYPENDRPNLPLPTTVPMFCLPMGCSLEKWPKSAQEPVPIFSTFVLTVSDAAEKLYGSAVTFYEPYSRNKLTEEQKIALGYSENDETKDDWTFNINKCICLLSRWPFFDTYERFLNFLYEMSTSPISHPVPIERFITYLIEDIPFPSQQRPRILVQLSPTDRLILTQPEDVPLPRSGAGFRQLLMHLGSDNCLLLLLCGLTEQKILVHSLRPDVLTAVAEAISMIMFPFKWQCPYIPLCPLGLAEVLHAPVPYLIGVDSRFFDLHDLPSDVNSVDLDTNNITFCEEKRHLSIKLLPKKAGRTLRNNLDVLSEKLKDFIKQSMEPVNQSITDNSIDKEFQMKKKEQNLELEIQEAFLKFMATILKGYRNFLLPITKAPTVGTTDATSLFDLQGFLRSREKTHGKFFSLVTKTQMFIRFIEERSFVSDMDAGLAFFDECTEKMDSDDENVRLLELDESQHSDRTVFFMPPEPTGETFVYKGFNLDPALLRRPCCGWKHQTGETCDGRNKIANINAQAKDKIDRGRFSGNSVTPGSPMARRTKYEIKTAQKLARKFAASPPLWAKCLLGTCYSIWFIHLPSYILTTQNPPAILRYAYELLVKIHKNKTPADEICYRVMMQLCGVYSQPVVAVKLLFHMKRSNLQPNAITYGFYNRAVLEAKWPSGMSNSSQLLWNKLRNVIVGAALFRKAGLTAGRRRLSLAGEDIIGLADRTANCGSRTSIDSADSVSHKFVDNCIAPTSEGFAAFDKFRSRLGSIVRPTGLPLINPTTTFKQQQPFESSAGLLMTGIAGPLIEEQVDLGLSDHSPTSATSPTLGQPLCNSGGSPGAGIRRWTYRSGSCTDFHHRQPPPVSPPPVKPSVQDNSYKILTRSESFANDAGILAKLHTLKAEVMPTNYDVKNKGTQHSAFNSNSKSLFNRRGSLNLLKFKDNNAASDSYESSTENIGSSVGSAGGGSFEEINRMDTPKRSRLINALGARLNKYNSPGQQNDLRHSTATSEEQLNSSLLKSPSRTPVTENDPLGALANEDEENNESQPQIKTQENVSLTASEIELDQCGAPVLFDRRTNSDWGSSTVPRSATFTKTDESDEELSTHMHRSSTMPINSSSTATTTESQPVFGPFKLPFTRYSPGRFSLRKAADRINAQMIESAITSLSPSSLTSKKSNEILLGGLSSLKSAANTVAKKFDEIKGVISANSTPVKSASHRSTLERETFYENDTDCTDENPSGTQRRKISSEFSPLNRAQHLQTDLGSANFAEWLVDSSSKGSDYNLGESVANMSQPSILMSWGQREASAPVALQIVMTTCSKCHNCNSILYDEEIMAGWTPEDSNLNTKCQFCGKATVPLLSVTVLDFRNSPMPPSSNVTKERKVSTISLGTSGTHLGDGSADGQEDPNSSGEPPPGGGITDPLADPAKAQPVTSDPITVPYLNPLVLRKEFESILATEGDSCLTYAKFADEHPIIYWNMVWAFTRINIESHLPGLALGCASALTEPHQSWANATAANVLVSTMWHNPRLHDEVGQPMFLSWNRDNQPSTLVSALVMDQTTVPQSVMQKTISCLQCGDLIEPLKFLAFERQKLKGRGHSLYREILFLGITALGRENIDQIIFDREYCSAYEKLPYEKDPKLYLRSDQPLSIASFYCRQFFRPLEL
ncbi:DENN domain-containing protein Crag isoform X2 [Rhodnius prolixus]